MENLNDVEFGSDKSTEEAPILIAQRYLNIYRQIHIFNKEKRDQFDNELLALPQNVSDFFKRMPGGRLLVEHIEEVKTERGISFVKSNKEDFTNGADTNNTATGMPAVNPQAISGATVAIDASFAQTLAQSMANAFKQLPAGVSTNSGVTPSATDFSKAFELIAEEIKISRTSLLDVLQEMHVMTSSLIASQVSIARTLEKLLDRPLNIQNMKLQEQRPLYEKAHTSMNNEQPIKNSAVQIIDKPISMQNNLRALSEEAVQISTETQSFVQNAEHTSAATVALPADVNITDEAQRKKKKKKKKNKENRNLENGNTSTANSGQNFQVNTHNNLSANQNKEPSLITKSEKIVPALGEIVHEAVAKHVETSEIQNNMQQAEISEEGRQSLRSDAPFLNTESPDYTGDALSLSSDKTDYDTFNLDDLPDLIDDKSLSDQPVQPTILQEQTNNFLDYNLPEREMSLNETSVTQTANENLENIFSSDGLDFALPEQNSAVEGMHASQATNESLDSIFNGDGLDFALPEQSIAVEETSAPQTVNKSLDNTFSDDGLDFALPEQNTTVEEMRTPQFTDKSLDNIFNDDGLDFVLPEQNSAVERTSAPQVTSESLDDIFNGSGADFVRTGQNSISELSPTSQVTNDSLDDLFSDAGLDSVITEQDSTTKETSVNQPTSKVLDNIFHEDNMDLEGRDNTVEDIFAPQTANEGLDSIFDEDKSEFSLADTAPNSPQKNTSQESFSALDDIFTGNIEDTISHAQSSTQINEVVQETHPSRYSEELDRIRAALTSDNIDISSLDQPIELDDYSDDESILNKEDDDIPAQPAFQPETEQQPNTQDVSDDEEWEWEYVDENGNPVSASDDEEWEWEYVEDDSENTSDNNSK